MGEGEGESEGGESSEDEGREKEEKEGGGGGGVLTSRLSERKINSQIFIRLSLLASLREGEEGGRAEVEFPTMLCSSP